MNATHHQTAERKRIAIRLLYTILYLVVIEILRVIVHVTVLFQYVYLLITRTHNEPVRKFTNKVSAYIYRTVRYVTLNENTSPFPLNDFPGEIDPPDPHVLF